MEIKLSDKALNRIAMVVAGYSKRSLEGVYNEASHTAIAQRLKSMPRVAIFSTELALYILGALLVERLGDDTPLMKLLTEVITDAPSEISKRLINGEAELTDLKGLFKAMTPDKQEEVIKQLLVIGGQSIINKKSVILKQETEKDTDDKPLPNQASTTIANWNARLTKLRKQRQERRRQ